MNPLQQIISNDIRKTGWISFERFMELALYCPEYGFYEKEADKLGRQGDFFTSVSVGPLFGEMLAFQFAEWLDGIRSVFGNARSAKPLRIVEAGAYNGQLAHDILTAMQRQRPDLLTLLEYCIVEPSIRLQRKQMAFLGDFGPKLRWFKSLDDLKALGGIVGVMFSNELLDAMPVRRLGWDRANGRWFEWGVSLGDTSLRWTTIPSVLNPAELPAVSPELLEVLPDGHIVETCPAALEWWRQAAGILVGGKLMTVDYGYTAGDVFSPERTKGTLRTYSKHHAGDDLLARPGEQDITAHVNFPAVQQVGEVSGLATERFYSQEKFLVSIAEKTWKRPEHFGEWNPVRRRQLQTLVHPQHLGRPFKVLVQGRSERNS